MPNMLKKLRILPSSESLESSVKDRPGKHEIMLELTKNFDA